VNVSLASRTARRLARAKSGQRKRIDAAEAAELKADLKEIADDLVAIIDGGCTVEEAVELATDIGRLAVHFVAALKD
jgi:hypothetical protein